LEYEPFFSKSRLESLAFQGGNTQKSLLIHLVLIVDNNEQILQNIKERGCLLSARRWEKPLSRSMKEPCFFIAGRRSVIT